MDFSKIISGLTSSGIGSGLAGGVAGGALVSALGSKSGRKTAATLLKVGGIAAVGGLAWKAYQSYQQTNGQQTNGQQVNAQQGNAQQVNAQQGNAQQMPQTASPQSWQANNASQAQPDWRGLEQQQFEAIVDKSNESAGMLLLRSTISAAMADGQLSQTEQGQIFAKLEELSLTSEERGTLLAEMAKPWTTADFGNNVTDPVIAIEVYAAALMTIDDTCEAGRAHLRSLANALRLPVPLVTSLHARVLEQEGAA